MKLVSEISLIQSTKN